MRIIYKPEKEERLKTAVGFEYKYTPAKICIMFDDNKETEVNFYASYFAKCEKKVNAIENAKNDKERKKAIKELTERKTLSEVLKIMSIRINSFACSLDDAEEVHGVEVFTGLRAVVNYLLAEKNAKTEKKASKKASKPAPVVEPVAAEVEPVADAPAPVVEPVAAEVEPVADEPAPVAEVVADAPASDIENIITKITKAIEEGPSIKEIIKKAELKTAEERDNEMRENDPEYRKMAIVKDIFENAEKRAKATKNEPDENAKDEKGRFINEDKERERVYAKMAKMNPFEKLMFVKLYNAGLTA